jgi:hypothetical protein
VQQKNGGRVAGSRLGVANFQRFGVDLFQRREGWLSRRLRRGSGGPCVCPGNQTELGGGDRHGGSPEELPPTEVDFV